jgi:hypothetical protein
MKKQHKVLFAAIPLFSITLATAGVFAAETPATPVAGTNAKTHDWQKTHTPPTAVEIAQHEADMQERIKADIASGKITQAQADEIAAKHKAKEAAMDANLSKVLGVTIDELAADKTVGKTIDQIITEKGLNKEAVFKALEASMPKGERGGHRKGPHGNKGEFKNQKQIQ